MKKNTNIKIGDKVIAKRDGFFVNKSKVFNGYFANKGKIFNVYYIDDKNIYMEQKSPSHMIKFSIDWDTFNTYFEKYEEPKPKSEPKSKKAVETTKVTSKMVDDILEKSAVTVSTLYDKCTLVAVRLPNGFVITETSSCVDPKNYNEKLGVKACMKRIKDKIWELEGYLLQDKLSKDGYAFESDTAHDNDCFAYYDCDTCPYFQECNCEEFRKD